MNHDHRREGRRPGSRIAAGALGLVLLAPAGAWAAQGSSGPPVEAEAEEPAEIPVVTPLIGMAETGNQVGFPAGYAIVGSTAQTVLGALGPQTADVAGAVSEVFAQGQPVVDQIVDANQQGLDQFRDASAALEPLAPVLNQGLEAGASLLETLADLAGESIQPFDDTLRELAGTVRFFTTGEG